MQKGIDCWNTVLTSKFLSLSELIGRTASAIINWWNSEVQGYHSDASIYAYHITNTNQKNHNKEPNSTCYHICKFWVKMSSVCCGILVNVMSAYWIWFPFTINNAENYSTFSYCFYRTLLIVTLLYVSSLLWRTKGPVALFLFHSLTLHLFEGKLSKEKRINIVLNCMQLIDLTQFYSGYVTH